MFNGIMVMLFLVAFALRITSVIVVLTQPHNDTTVREYIYSNMTPGDDNNNAMATTTAPLATTPPKSGLFRTALGNGFHPDWHTDHDCIDDVNVNDPCWAPAIKRYNSTKSLMPFIACWLKTKISALNMTNIKLDKVSTEGATANRKNETSAGKMTNTTTCIQHVAEDCLRCWVQKIPLGDCLRNLKTRKKPKMAESPDRENDEKVRQYQAVFFFLPWHASNSSYARVPRDQWPDTEPMLISEIFFCVASILAFAKVLWMFQVRVELCLG